MTLIEFARFARANALRVLIVALIGGALAYVYASRLPKVFVADSSGYVVGDTPTNNGEVFAGMSLGATKAKSYVGLVNSRAVGELTMKATGINTSPSDLASRVSAYVIPDSVILKVTAYGPTPEEAQRLADAVLNATAEVANRIELGGEVKAGQKGVVKIVQVENALPGAQVAPNIQKITLVGAGGGFALAFGLLLLRRQLDTKVRTVKDVEGTAGAAVLGVVPVTPELKARKGRGKLGQLGLAAESFRQIRTNLRFVNVDQPPRSIVITSANAGEGKSTVSSTLARVLGEAGQPTILIDADLRRPMLATIFDAHGSVGLSQLLSQQITLEEALQDTDQENVKLITSGRVPPNPSELLGSQRMHQLIEQLTRTHLVILDAPPLLPVTDAGLLSGMCDGTLLVLAVGRTQREQATQCGKVLEQVGGKLLGTVMNLAPKKGIGSVVYGYGYGSSYKSEYYTNAKYVGRRGKKANAS